ncbi:hypothetical protein BABINDRAFT_160266 [Babjeviella inositovora NRRL Y-12698]|uniref:Myb-like domain-containing protein n=1 Tax=Babjeviella inositovora NRRL Y-12698 TaxID=984486 RepID=A0A1E3QWK3_9ASCO|nr:uncharacterized protein BABINDRAFT_160266 [Babjeviella inositovora NRRL Y-12698]ODQ82069.1 hypothetical protein BABINDRAFT_160266 [Babjeviella inositovora NRRL Y-12698]
MPPRKRSLSLILLPDVGRNLVKPLPAGFDPHRNPYLPPAPSPNVSPRKPKVDRDLLFSSRLSTDVNLEAADTSTLPLEGRRASTGAISTKGSGESNGNIQATPASDPQGTGPTADSAATAAKTDPTTGAPSYSNPLDSLANIAIERNLMQQQYGSEKLFAPPNFWDMTRKETAAFQANTPKPTIRFVKDLDRKRLSEETEEPKRAEEPPRKVLQRHYKWTPEDDSSIIYYKEVLNYSWKDISRIIASRHTWQAIQMRYLRCLKDRNASWSAEEETRLMLALEQDWDARWKRVSVALGPAFTVERCLSKAKQLSLLIKPEDGQVEKPEEQIKTLVASLSYTERALLCQYLANVEERDEDGVEEEGEEGERGKS